MKLGPHFRRPDALNCNLIVGHYLICKYLNIFSLLMLMFYFQVLPFWGIMNNLFDTRNQLTTENRPHYLKLAVTSQHRAQTGDLSQESEPFLITLYPWTHVFPIEDWVSKSVYTVICLQTALCHSGHEPISQGYTQTDSLLASHTFISLPMLWCVCNFYRGLVDCLEIIFHLM